MVENKTVGDLTENWYTTGNVEENDSNQSEAKEDEKEVNGDNRKETLKWTKSRIESQSRRFNIDLTPRLLFSRLVYNF